ncbi:binding-protein-dependent transport systems inner membrane component [Segniliparus rotundus DSM 44985]|uniref:Binding-protein-dependent transport systems inner membrane component n=1 Tax=Segniliparus rotundus (strain ATCC BAA-972 / CDC 1076 / CIP 108378 / DSM 44985 / JCM 13578) TaxID=640132 RepID=D6ZEH8_SEGRD|nr:ABC transporter permease [Segniliparus rotundus]ADG99454.1 binding-protein-dependent transport systems inner membrane component [Segniliparus rotundus DSM 44985]
MEPEKENAERDALARGSADPAGFPLPAETALVLTDETGPDQPEALAPRTGKTARRKRFFGNVHGAQRAILLAGLALMAFLLCVAVLAPWIAPYTFDQTKNKYGVDFDRQAPPSAAHVFGTSVRGEDVFSRVVYGTQTAFEVILVSLVIAGVIGVVLGLVSGYFGGWLDRILTLVMDSLYAFPSLLLAILVSVGLATGSFSNWTGALSHWLRGNGLPDFTGVAAGALAVCAVFIPQYYRVIRASALVAKNEPYVDAARVCGASTGRVLFRHVLPNITQSLPVIAALNSSEAILTLAGLGFLGFGVEPSQAAEWGYDVNKGIPDITGGVWWTSVFPGVAIVLAVLATAFVGESLSEAGNPLLRSRPKLRPKDLVKLAADEGAPS